MVNNMLEKIKKYKEWYLLIVFFIGIISSVFLTMHNVLNKNDEILAKLETTQQMALKSVIWNDNIPLVERATACDKYLSAGYNSMTKKECEIIIRRAEVI